MAPITPEEYFQDSPLGLAVHREVHHLLVMNWPDVAVRTTKSQVAFRRERGFAFLWRPRQYLRAASADVVLSLALSRRLESVRFKQVVQPSRGTWMHHLEIGAVEDVDQEVEEWLDEAAAAAGPRLGAPPQDA